MLPAWPSCALENWEGTRGEKLSDVYTLAVPPNTHTHTNLSPKVYFMSTLEFLKRNPHTDQKCIHTLNPPTAQLYLKLMLKSSSLSFSIT